jgi:hypothetical protein
MLELFSIACQASKEKLIQVCANALSIDAGQCPKAKVEEMRPSMYEQTCKY